MPGILEVCFDLRIGLILSFNLMLVLVVNEHAFWLFKYCSITLSYGRIKSIIKLFLLFYLPNVKFTLSSNRYNIIKYQNKLRNTTWVFCRPLADQCERGCISPQNHIASKAQICFLLVIRGWVLRILSLCSFGCAYSCFFWDKHKNKTKRQECTIILKEYFYFNVETLIK